MLIRKILFCHSKIKFISSRHCVISSLYFTLLLTILSIFRAIQPTLSPFIFEIKLSHIKSNNGLKTWVPSEKPRRARQKLNPCMVLSPELHFEKNWMGSTVTTFSWHDYEVGWFSNRTGTSDDDGRPHGIGWILLLVDHVLVFLLRACCRQVMILLCCKISIISSTSYPDSEDPALSSEICFFACHQAEIPHLDPTINT